MNEDRIQELESWTQDSREGLTTSECVLLDAIAEACREVRRLWAIDGSRTNELVRLEARVGELQNALGQDRLAMEAADLELALGESGSPEKARELLAHRLEALDSLGQEPPRSADKTDARGLAD